MRRRLALDGLNFCLADAASVLGPILGVFLLTQHQWDQASIGLVAMIGGLTGIAVKVPIGAAIDATHHKRGLLVAALAGLSVAAIAVATSPTWAMVAIASVVIALAQAVFGPSIAAFTLGLFDRTRIANRMGRNGAFDHAGNVFAALLAGAIGSLVSQRAVFMLVPLFSLFAACCVLAIRPSDIDHERARGADDGLAKGIAPEGIAIAELLRHGSLLLLATCLALFHLANAAMLPLVGQRLALAHAGYESAMMSACIVAAQLVMLPVALLCGAWADRLGRRPILLVAFAVLPLRGLLYTLSDAPAWLIGVQLLDGIGAGVLGVMMPLVVADLTRGTGRYNFSLGGVAMVGGVGAALSNALAGAIVVSKGYDTAFTALAVVAFAALLLLWGMLPETAPKPAGSIVDPTPRRI
jgi:MFS family permease